MSSEKPILSLSKQRLSALISKTGIDVLLPPCGNFLPLQAIIKSNEDVWSLQEPFSAFSFLKHDATLERAFFPFLKLVCRYLPQGTSFVVIYFNSLIC